MVITESQLQKSVAKFLNGTDLLWWHTPNGQKMKSAHIGRQWKLDGVKAGVPDVLIVKNGRLYGIELKRPKGPKGSGVYAGKLTDDQKAFHIEMQVHGCLVSTCTSVSEVENVLIEWGLF